MKIETTFTIEADLLEQVDELAKDCCSRSEFIEQALLQYVEKKQRQKKHKMSKEEEAAIVNRYVEENREEIRENMRFQAELILGALDRNETR